MTAFRTVECSDPALTPEGLCFVTVKSPALGQRADITLFVPPQAQGHTHVPIVVLLHGMYSSHWAWAYKGGAHRTTQRLIDAKALPPLVLAMPSDGLWGDGTGYVPHTTQDFERWVVEEVPAAAQQACAACGPQSPLCIAGLSMGGFAALRLAGKHPGRFAAAAAHSSATEAAQFDPLLAESRSSWSGNPADLSVLQALRSSPGPLPPLRFDCGSDDLFIGANRQLHAELQAAGIAHSFIENTGGHDWAYWARHLEDSLRFFGQVLQHGRVAP